MNFYQFYNVLNGESYSDPRVPPKEYDFLDYAKMISNGSKIAGTEENNWQLTPLEQDDMKTSAAEDVADAYVKIHKKNPLSIGDPLSDEEFRKYQGLR